MGIMGKEVVALHQCVKHVDTEEYKETNNKLCQILAQAQMLEGGKERKQKEMEGGRIEEEMMG